MDDIRRILESVILYGIRNNDTDVLVLEVNTNSSVRMKEYLFLTKRYLILYKVFHYISDFLERRGNVQFWLLFDTFSDFQLWFSICGFE